MARGIETQANDLNTYLVGEGLKEGSLVKRVKALVANTKRETKVGGTLRKARAAGAGKTGRAKKDMRTIGSGSKKTSRPDPSPADAVN